MVRQLCLSVLLLALCGAGCGWFSSADSPREQALRKMHDAEGLNEARDYQRAAEGYEEALRIDPSNPEPHFKAAVIYDKKLDQFLPAIYHYEAFLKMESDPEKSKLASDFLNNAQFQYVATLPQFKKLANPDLTRLQTENEGLHRQISDLKTELIRVRSEKTSPPVPVAVARPKEKKTAGPSPEAAPPAPKTYKVQRGDGLQTIARKVYGDRTKWRTILQANPQLKDAEDLHVGQVLKIP